MAKPFEFSLQPALRMKRHQEWLASVEQYKAQSAFLAARAEQRKLEQNLAELSRLMAEGRLGLSWLQFRDQVELIRQQLDESERAVAMAADRLAEKAAERKKLATDVEVLSALREKQWQEYTRELARAEQERLDEVGLQRWLSASESERR
ncbi:MAG: hypothetical protein KatS3mg105_4263 [Gemmatales bacterium]|nr:MAG: hypothetical protein KatS3mg105_4263 [Gemmatales bacterium]